MSPPPNLSADIEALGLVKVAAKEGRWADAIAGLNPLKHNWRRDANVCCWLIKLECALDAWSANALDLPYALKIIGLLEGAFKKPEPARNPDTRDLIDCP